MTKFAFSIIITLLFIGCNKYDAQDETSSLPVSTLFEFCGSELDPAGRGLTEIQESAIQNINIYLFHKKTPKSYHQYVTNANIPMTIIPGEYTAYVIANYNSDLGNITAAALDALSIPSYDPDGRGNIIMVNKLDITISSSNPNIPITLYRNVAKIALSLNVASGLDIRLQSFRLMNLPMAAPLINRITNSSTTASNYTNGFRFDISSSTSYKNTFYMLENKQGEKSTITTQQGKNLTNAPSCATYCHITAISLSNPDRIIEYYIFLGENNTSDFNVRRNTLHTINATISGVNTIDTRVQTTTITHTNSSAYMYHGQDISGSINITSTNSAKRFTGGIFITNGTASGYTLKVNGSSYTPSTDFNMSGATTNYSLVYAPTTMTSANNTVGYTFSVLDENGNTRSFTKNMPCYFKVTSSVEPSTAGTLTLPTGYAQKVGNDLFYAPTATNSETRTIKVTPNAGYSFTGWFKDGIKVETSASYSFAINNNISLAAKFKATNKITATSTWEDIVLETQYPTASDIQIYIEYDITEQDEFGSVVSNLTSTITIKKGDSKFTLDGYYNDPWDSRQYSLNSYVILTTSDDKYAYIK